MKSILEASGVPQGWGFGSNQGDRPAYAVKGAFNPARVRPDWAQKTDPRPIFPHNASGPFADPFPILTGAAYVPDPIMKAPKSAVHDYYHRERNT